MFSLTVGTFVAVGSHIRVSYLGSLCELEVVEIIVENGETVGSVHSTDEANVSDRLSAVHLSSEPNKHQFNTSQRFFRCVNGTCVTLYKPPSAGRQDVRAAITLDDVGGTNSQKEFLARLVLSMLDVDRADAITRSGELYSDGLFIFIFASIQNFVSQ